MTANPTLPGLEDAAPAAAAARRRKSAKTEKVRVGQTAILIYWRKPDAKRKNGGWVFRYYLAGKAHVVERAKLVHAKEEALRIAVGIENGRAQTGSMSAGEAEGYFHAMNQLGKLGEAAPSLGVALSEYITAKQLLPPDVSLAEAVRGFLKVNPGVGGTAVPVVDVIERFLLRTGDGASNPRYLRGLRADLRAFATAMPAGQGLNEIDADGIAKYLRGLKDRRGRSVGPRRRDNVRNELVSLFRFAKASSFLPPDRQTAPELVKRLSVTHEIRFYQPDQLRTILVHAQTRWVPWVVLAAFGGLRSSEIVGDPEAPGRPRLRWSDFRWDKGYIVVPASVARKVKRARRVPLRANLLEWLLPWRNATGHLYPEGTDQSSETQRLRRATKKRPAILWDGNALRHSYGTHRNAEISNAGQLAEEMGTSIAMIRKHYDAVPADIEPEEYFSIRPGVGGKIIPMPAQGS